MRADQLDATMPQAFPQRIAVIGFVGNHTQGLLSRTPGVMASAHADRRQRFFREPDFGEAE
jgi:hypothetical protein